MTNQILSSPKHKMSTAHPARTKFLQRRHDAGGTAGPAGEWKEFRKKGPSLQRKTNSIEPGTRNDLSVPPVVYEVLRSPGQPLDLATRAFMEPRFGHEFSQVRVHSDGQAAESARSINALAYTVGRDVVFGTRQYAPGTTVGDKLLAHELTHVVQQGAQSCFTGGPLKISHPGDPGEVEAARAAEMSERKVEAHTSPIHIQRLKAAEFPGYSQGAAVTCGAASLVTALMIWDNERKSSTAPNEMVVTACNIVLTHIDDHKAALIKGWKDQGKPGDDLYDDAFIELKRIRDDARKAGAKTPESDYQLLSGILVILFGNAASGGMSKLEIMSIQTRLGLSSGVQSTTQAQTFDDLFADPVLTGLKPGQVAQIFWYLQDKKGNPIVSPTHVFLAGRFLRGEWFLSDQGTKPPTELEAVTPLLLKIALQAEVLAGRASIFTGAKPILLPSPFTGVVMLGERSGVEKQAENVVLTPGTFIAEVDETVIYGGEKLYTWDFVARTYSLGDAETAFNSSGSGHGGLIIENPTGLFHVFKTNPLKDKTNLKATSIDEGDSKGGYLMQKSRYYHAWLRLCLATSCNPSFFKVR